MKHHNVNPKQLGLVELDKREMVLTPQKVTDEIMKYFTRNFTL